MVRIGFVVRLLAARERSPKRMGAGDMEMRGSETALALDGGGAAASGAHRGRHSRRPRAVLAFVALIVACAVSVALAPGAQAAATSRSAAPSLSVATPVANAASWGGSPGLATLAGVPEVEPGRIRLNLYCNGESTCRGWLTLVANGLRLVSYRWVGYRRVITHVRHQLLLGATDFEIAPGGTDTVTLTLSARNRRILHETGGLPATLAGKDLTPARFQVKLPSRKCWRPAPVIEH